MNTTFYLLHGNLRVEARGYWYSGGGVKGSFGYYPHLKGANGLPIIADTQLHGDLRMASKWAGNLGVDAALLDRIFGKEGNETAALLHVGDLTLAAPAQWEPHRFQIKPRIEIDDATRAVRGKMLANFEVAWLQDLIMEAPLYVGYFTKTEDLEKARKLLNEAVRLLSGFGAFRSRGYGRGKVAIAWAEPEVTTITDEAASTGRFTYSLESLVNVRSKPVAAEKLQLLETASHVASEQLRGWFVRTFEQISGRWPDIDEMATITFPDLNPSPSRRSSAFRPPMTALRKEDDSSIDDFWDKEPEGDDNFARGETYAESGTARKNKLKPLKPGIFFATDGGQVCVETTVRIRNSMADDFRTLEKGGLFVQQYLPRGTIFCGEIVMQKPGSDFGRQAHAILSGLKPTINGNLFLPAAIPSTAATQAEPGPFLLTAPIGFDPNRNTAPKEGILIGTSRRYSPVLARPRRGRPVMQPGSVLLDDTMSGAISWPLFGKNLATAPPSPEIAAPLAAPAIAVPLAERGISWKNVTRSQAGILRELLNTDHNPEVIGKYLRDIRDKHMEKQRDSDLAILYAALAETYGHENPSAEKLRNLVKEILDYLKSEIWWKEKAKNQGSGRNK